MNKKILFSLLVVIIIGVLWDIGKKDNKGLVLVEQDTQVVLDDPSIAEIGEWVSSQKLLPPEPASQEMTTEDVVQANEQEIVQDVLTPEKFSQAINIEMTPKQHETFLVLDAYLADPTYVSTLSIAELSQSPEFKSLPEVLQLALASKAVSHFNKGNVSPEAFYRQVQQ